MVLKFVLEMKSLCYCLKLLFEEVWKIFFSLHVLNYDYDDILFYGWVSLNIFRFYVEHGITRG